MNRRRRSINAGTKFIKRIESSGTICSGTDSSALFLNCAIVNRDIRATALFGASIAHRVVQMNCARRAERFI